MSSLAIIFITIYITIVLGFAVIIEVSRRKYDGDFTILQLLVPFIWPIWGIWYLGSLITDALRRKK